MNRIKLFVGIPSYDGRIETKCITTLQTLLERMVKLELICDYCLKIHSGSLINRVRNELVGVFMKTDFSHFLFLDSDLSGFELCLIKMILAKKRIIGGTYRIKCEEEKYNINLCNSVNKTLEECSKNEQGVVEVENIATGLMLIHRNVFVEFMDKYPNMKYYLGVKNKKEEWNFFHSFIHPDKRIYLSEDFGFCYLLKKIGIPIYAQIKNGMKHHGHFTYSGNFEDYLNKILSNNK